MDAVNNRMRNVIQGYNAVGKEELRNVKLEQKQHP